MHLVYMHTWSKFTFAQCWILHAMFTENESRLGTNFFTFLIKIRTRTVRYSYILMVQTLFSTIELPFYVVSVVCSLTPLDNHNEVLNFLTVDRMTHLSKIRFLLCSWLDSVCAIYLTHKWVIYQFCYSCSQHHPKYWISAYLFK